MPRLRALTSWADRRQGDEWDATDADARVLCACDLPGGQKAELVDRVMRPTRSESPRVESTQDESPPAPKQQTDKRRYLRRDLRAQR
jgi:hypothetical protein